MPTNPLPDLREWIASDNADADPQCACNILRAHGPAILAALELAERVAGAQIAWLICHNGVQQDIHLHDALDDYLEFDENATSTRVALVPITDDASSGGGE